jgi:hypothetical protein
VVAIESYDQVGVSRRLLEENKTHTKNKRRKISESETGRDERVEKFFGRNNE